VDGRFVSDVVFLLGFLVAAIVLPVGTLGVARWIRPSHRETIKSQPYESGMLQASAPRRPFHMAYYTFALIFVVFEVETVLLFAIAPVLRQMGWLALAEVAAFVATTALGLFYAWRKGVLVWR
jgi:NADH-quinone oxidoreductase subunit A